MTDNNKALQNPKAYKSQPWTLYDTVVARSFLLGDTSPDGLAVGSQVPALSSSGEIQFFGQSARTAQNMPWYSNQDLPGQLSYGFRVWQIFLEILFPATTEIASVNPNRYEPPLAATTLGIVPGALKLAEAILNFGTLQMNLGQEQQANFPLTRFGAGGGLSVAGLAGMASINNGWPVGSNVLKLPEPIEMPRTQNMSAKIRLAPEIFQLIGSPAAPGVGAPLAAYDYATTPVNPPVPVSLPQQPFSIRLGLVGQRIKATQYGQLVRTGG